ncbi:hypothetical protein BS50DRAFT_216764 [Corynespora cassiicola Philippines]|uniref:DUF8035 domain-containing protein n=1 Tax=Corynespora cassiicola Philippines TaxID=1448308 RepID=A0A2T2N3P6_CORCC|nr:hypothetical protein BS50DRAFT_216764 [Corynespora cassiicola Philippines]
MSRRYPTAELYEERQRDFYRNGNRSERSYDELDIELNRGNPRRSQPDFLHEDYNRPSAGPLVVRGRQEDEMSRAPPRSHRDFDQDTLVLRGGRPPPPPSSVREVERDDISIRRSEPERRRPREVEREETDITIRRREQSRPRAPEVREFEREEINFRRGDGPRPRPREVDVEREDIRFQERAPPSRRGGEREDFVFRHEHREDSRHGRERSVERDSITIRNRERSLPPPRPRGDLIAREREEFVVRRREPPSPPPPAPREVIKDEIIIRRKEERSPTPPPPPPPPPPPEPEVRPPIIQEIITHHRHIDHGVERARSPTPPPPPPSPPRDDKLEISIRRKESRGRDFELEYERETIERSGRELEISRSRGRSLSTPRRSYTAPPDNDFELEADYYNRKALERAYPGEAYNGATKDWAIVDVPPGTNRVRMDGIGGGSQEVTWQRYNGVRRSKFISGDEEHATDFGMPTSAPVKPKAKDMWTEITKDLVLKEAIDSCGYEYEETDYFFYVMEYLKYEDVLQLVEISDDIRRRRKSRIRQIEYEREEIRDRRPPGWDERYYEHEVSYDRHRHRYR